MDRYSNVKFVGLSATPYSKGLGKFWDDLIVPCTAADLLGQGYLAPVHYYGGAKIEHERTQIESSLDWRQRLRSE
jgi:DNA repair protein RadD